MTPTVVIQSKQGIGDVIWHLPFIRAIAAGSPGGVVTFMTLPSTHARELLEAEPCVAQTLYFENRGSELKRGLDILRLIDTLRRLRCDTAWVLDRSARPAFCAMMAGVRRRIGVGFWPQRLFITNPGIDPKLAHAHPISWLEALMVQTHTPYVAEPDLRLPAGVVDVVATRYRGLPRPWIVLALGGSHPAQHWPMPHWTTFLIELRRRTTGSIYVIGGPDYAAKAQMLIDATTGGPATALNACDLTISEAAALLGQSDLFVGPDTGPMNIAAAVGTPAFALFGASRVLTYSKYIHAIRPDDGGPPTLDGMARISPARVLERIEAHLASTSARTRGAPAARCRTGS